MPLLKRPPPGDIAAQHPAVVDTSTAMRRILIAEDDYALAQVLTKRCREIDLDVFRSPDAMHALLGVHRIRPDLLLLDVHLSSGSGLSVCEFLMADKSGLSTIPVIIMSGQSDEETLRRCRSMGARFVQKGADLWSQLQPLIDELLSGETRRPADNETFGSANGTQSATPADAEQPARLVPRVLCIDDDPDISKIIKLRLARYGVEVHRAFEGMQGYWTSLDMHPDVIISDMVMPDGQGNYIVSRLQQHSLTKDIPVIMLTGQQDPGLKRQMLAMGVEAYLTKPIVFDELLEELRKHIVLTE
ncbi:MAG TPA: response regulator [Pirellulales bacterium]|nr:response regulator [Pirellulales bacterium]